MGVTATRRTAVSALLAAAAGAALALLPPAPVSAEPNSKDEKAALKQIREATAKYRDVSVAIADGYHPTDVCVESPAGGMGLHYVNPARFGSMNPSAPDALLYRQVGSQRQLIAVEWLKPDADQDLSTTGDRPSLFGHAFDGPMPGHEPGMPVHYDLHVWAWHSNPAGDFSSWNPSINC